jgi:secretion/DNA translocation related TadE-like protein
VIAVLVFVAIVSVGAVAIVLAHRQAQAAADLASLAGAAALQRGADPCASASAIAGRQRATVSACRADGSALSVTAAVRLPRMLGGGQVLARARAGPASLLPGDAGQQ